MRSLKSVGYIVPQAGRGSISKHYRPKRQIRTRGVLKLDQQYLQCQETNLQRFENVEFFVPRYFADLVVLTLEAKGEIFKITTWF